MHTMTDARKDNSQKPKVAVVKNDLFVTSLIKYDVGLRIQFLLSLLSNTNFWHDFPLAGMREATLANGRPQLPFYRMCPV